MSLSSRTNIALALAACLGCATPAFAAAEKASIDTIDGRKVESVTIRHPASKVVVVFESGLRGTLEKWDKVLDAVSPNATVFAYNRPGYVQSDVTDAPRDGATIVEQLRQVLRQKGLAPPYVLVGHSLGGLYMQLFARRYPNEVQGIVLVDSLMPKMMKKPESLPLTTRIGKQLFFSGTVGREIDGIYDTGEIVAALPGIDHMPMIKLINVPKSATAIPVDFGAFNRDPATVAFVRGLYPNAKKVIVDSDHQMHSANPEVVAKAIADIIGAR
ncbi:alpha/beta hydrolase [Massilia eurypsychrophila]|jgi:pimeloyl-ACP methyl ester carboxylesterase|uniref:Alpha/beta hydrolase n=1 Tax=Massilia eurypsychrophila TaxID=1485217 RepID=A0A2G8T7T9_9BURK|nr:alpha/beta fold hydrolase [Massilia eurypsychrophila]PIL42120.1 alpha/beta hydrolase [Massilia eurypsychrophila]